MGKFGRGCAYKAVVRNESLGLRFGQPLDAVEGLRNARGVQAADVWLLLTDLKMSMRVVSYNVAFLGSSLQAMSILVPVLYPISNFCQPYRSASCSRSDSY